MQKTTNYNLNKPEETDFYNVDDFNDNADIIDAELKKAQGKTLFATLTAGQTSLEITDSSITTNSTIDPYTSSYTIVAENIEVEDGKITMTFEAQADDVDVKVVVK